MYIEEALEDNLSLSLHTWQLKQLGADIEGRIHSTKLKVGILSGHASKLISKVEM